LMAVGMSHVMAPCTDSIMGSLPRAKAGVGSAVNDTTRQMGGAIGVAVFGSLMASHFTSGVSGGFAGRAATVRADRHRGPRELRQWSAHDRLGGRRGDVHRRHRCGVVPAGS